MARGRDEELQRDNWSAAHEESIVESAAARFEAQLRNYETDKLACRLKCCCLLQLVASCAYVILPLKSPFGFLCFVAALLGFWAASRGRQKRLLQLACACSLLVVINGSILVSRLVASLYARDAADRMSTYRLLLGFAVVSSGVVLLQLFTLRYCSQLMRRGGANAANESSFSFFVHDDVQDLLHVDLARTPPDLEPKERVTSSSSSAAHHASCSGSGGGSSSESGFDGFDEEDRRIGGPQRGDEEVDRESALKLT